MFGILYPLDLRVYVYVAKAVLLCVYACVNVIERNREREREREREKEKEGGREGVPINSAGWKRACPVCTAGSHVSGGSCTRQDPNRQLEMNRKSREETTEDSKGLQ